MNTEERFNVAQKNYKKIMKTLEPFLPSETFFNTPQKASWSHNDINKTFDCCIVAKPLGK